MDVVIALDQPMRMTAEVEGRGLCLVYQIAPVVIEDSGLFLGQGLEGRSGMTLIDHPLSGLLPSGHCVPVAGYLQSLHVAAGFNGKDFHRILGPQC